MINVKQSWIILNWNFPLKKNFFFPIFPFLGQWYVWIKKKKYLEHVLILSFNIKIIKDLYVVYTCICSINYWFDCKKVLQHHRRYTFSYKLWLTLKFYEFSLNVLLKLVCFLKEVERFWRKFSQILMIFKGNYLNFFIFHELLLN